MFGRACIESQQTLFASFPKYFIHYPSRSRDDIKIMNYYINMTNISYTTSFYAMKKWTLTVISKPYVRNMDPQTSRSWDKLEVGMLKQQNWSGGHHMLILEWFGWHFHGPNTQWTWLSNSIKMQKQHTPQMSIIWTHIFLGCIDFKTYILFYQCMQTVLAHHF